MSSRRPLIFILPVVVALTAIVLWTWIHLSLSPDDRFLLPPPNEVWEAFLLNRTELLRAAGNTCLGALGGFGLAIAVSVASAIVLSFSPLVRASLYPYLMVLQMTPVIVFAPMLILWVGPGLKSVSIITFLICFFPLATNTTQGLISPDRSLVDLFRLYRASRWSELWHLRMPSSLPYFFTGLRIAATLAPIAALVGDYTAGNSAGAGLGFQTLIYSSRAQYPALMATAAVTCILGFILVGIVVVLSWICLHRWHDSYEKRDV